MSGDGDEAERLQVLEQYRKKVRSEAVLCICHCQVEVSRLFLEETSGLVLCLLPWAGARPRLL